MSIKDKFFLRNGELCFDTEDRSDYPCIIIRTEDESSWFHPYSGEITPHTPTVLDIIDTIEVFKKLIADGLYGPAFIKDLEEYLYEHQE